jgi:hypothetical protein
MFINIAGSLHNPLNNDEYHIRHQLDESSNVTDSTGFVWNVLE